jgi:dTDP-L-rhamnose 4-epimerase
MHALVTGGAGFIGSHLADALVARGASVRVLDNLLPQAHPTGEPRHVPREAQFFRGDVTDAEAVRRAAHGCDVVFHLAAMVGNGQSMLDIRRYTDVNVVGTATLVEAMVTADRRAARLVVSSSMVVYGDGAYRCERHGPGIATERPAHRLRAGQWEPVCARCGVEVASIATAETHNLAPTSTYGTSKRAEEELALVLGRAHALPTIALRYLNTYGSRQALANPYTGVCAIFATRILNGKAPHIFEDGKQLRDFIHVSDVVRANLKAATTSNPAALYRAFNVGTGTRRPIADIALAVARGLGRDIAPAFTGEYREGDIRHCFADVTAAADALEWTAERGLDDGLREFLSWAAGEAPDDRTDEANDELRRGGMIR